ncbi:MAG: endo-1,4-beta-xylanase [Clostridiales bacterium]|jgi:GH35 family endo-1,4-beta-xylanase|nr:endo-1,4-beta-xylanase [Clostridiales bacterium]
MIKVRMRNAVGGSLLRDELHTLYAADMKHVPFKRKTEVKNDGEILVYAPGYPVILNAKIVIPGYGFMWVQADNCGRGYSSGAAIEFVREAAVSRVYEVERELKKGGFAPSSKCLSKLNDAKTLLALAATSASAADFNITALAAGLWAGELAVLERARFRIATSGARGNFLFGCAGFDYPYSEIPNGKELFDSAFNYATLPFYLADMEPEYGAPRYERIDRLLDDLTNAGIKTKGHPLWWAHAASWPKWAMDLKWEDGTVQRELHRVVKRHVERYRGRIDLFDAINEAHDWCNVWNMSQDELVEMTKMCCDDVHEANPDARAVVNTCFMFGENAADGKVQWGVVNERNMVPYTYLKKCEEFGFQYEVIGMQLYLPSRDLMAIDRLYSRFAEFGKPMHLTELGVPSHKVDIPLSSREGDVYCLRYMYNGNWREFDWSERLQADWLEEFFTLSYSRPEIEALTWWSFYDPASYIPGAGLIFENGKPKEALFRLRALREMWGHNLDKG